MFTLKYVVLLAAMVAAAIAALPPRAEMETYASNKSHHLTVGYRMPGDRLVVTENIVKSSSMMRIVTVEKTFNTTRYDTITMVQALDQKTNGNGAFPSLLRGGPGHRNVTLRFKSQRGHGINFVVRIYARP